MNDKECRRMEKAEDTHWWYRSLHQFLINRIKRHVGTGNRVLDIGCGSGYFLEKLKNVRPFEIYGIEINSHLATAARKKGLSVTQACMSTALPSMPGKFLIILSIDSLYFLEPAEQVRLIRNGISKLAPGGIMMLHLPAGKGFQREHDQTVGITRRYTASEVRSILNKAAGPLKIDWKIRRRICLLSSGILARKLWQRFSPSLHPRSDLVIPPGPINRSLALIQKIEDHLPWVPWGSSLYIELRLKDST